MSTIALRLPGRHPRTFLLLAAAGWFALYRSLIPASEALVAALPVDRASHLGSALQFFFYDTPKVLLLLTGVVFVMGMINSYFTPERTRALLAGRSEGVANVMAASLGTVTPFCSCSAVPLFIGFVQAGVPLGVTFSFLISAPMVNEVALALLFGLFGWKIALLYLGLGLSVAIVAGWIIGRLKMEAYLEDWVVVKLIRVMFSWSRVLSSPLWLMPSWFASCQTRRRVKSLSWASRMPSWLLSCAASSVKPSC